MFSLWLPHQGSSNTISGDTAGCHVLFPLQVQDKLLLSACHLLVSLATTVRPIFLISIPSVQKVFNRITDASAQRLVDKVRPRVTLESLESCGSASGRLGKKSLAILSAPGGHRPGHHRRLSYTCGTDAASLLSCHVLPIMAVSVWIQT